MKKNNYTVYFGIFFVASILAEIYCIVEGINIIGVSAVVLIASYLFMDSYSTHRKAQQEEFCQMLNDKLSDMEQVEKRVFNQLCQNAEQTDQMMEWMKKENRHQLDVMMDNQSKTAKIIIKYIHEDIKALSEIERENAEKLAESVSEGLNEILASNESNSGNTDAIAQSLNNNFDNLIRHMGQSPIAVEGSATVQGMEAPQDLESPQDLEAVQDLAADSDSVSIMEEKVEAPVMAEAEEESLVEETVPEADDFVMPEMDEIPVEEEPQAEEAIEEPVIEEMPVMEEPQVEEAIEETPVMEEPVDPNKALNPDEIAALIASMGNEESKDEAVEEEPQAEEAIEEPVIEETPVMEEPVDPNKALNPDEIAALIASMGNEESKDEAKEEEPVKPVSEEKHVALTGIEAARQRQAAAKKEPVKPEVKAAPKAEPKPEPEPEPKPEPVAEAIEPVPEPADPNKALNPDEIAALFAAMGNDNSSAETETLEEESAAAEEAAVSATEEEPAAPEVDLSDPNKQLSAEEIAALFASMG